MRRSVGLRGTMPMAATGAAARSALNISRKDRSPVNFMLPRPRFDSLQMRTRGSQAGPFRSWSTRHRCTPPSRQRLVSIIIGSLWHRYTAAKTNPLPGGRGSSLRAERGVAEAIERRAFRGQRREHGLRAAEAGLHAERREQRAERLPPRPRLARRLHRRAEALHAPGVVREGAV